MSQAERLSFIIDAALKNERVISLGQISNFIPDNSEKTKSSNLVFTRSVLGMKAITHVIENQVLVTKNPCTLYVDCQRFSHFEPQSKRYQKILRAGNKVYLLGMPDAPVLNHSNLIPVAIEETAPGKPSLSNFWIVVLKDTGQMSMALVAREVAAEKAKGQIPEEKFSSKMNFRSFEGIRTFDNGLIEEIVGLLESYIKGHLLEPSHFDHPGLHL